MSRHQILWWVYAWDHQGNTEKMRRNSSMRGSWGYDVTCSCGWETNTGGGTRSHIQDEVRFHKFMATQEGAA